MCARRASLKAEQVVNGRFGDFAHGLTRKESLVTEPDRDYERRLGLSHARMA